jgi:hypothetical protein
MHCKRPKPPRIGLRAAACAAVASVLAACATPALVPGEPRIVDRVVIAPYAAHEACAELAAGERLDYRWHSSAPIDFDIRYRENAAVLSPIVREQSTGDSGIFAALIPARYCLDWQAGAPGAIIGYHILLQRRPG